MLTFDHIFQTRRSIRRYKTEKPGRDLIDAMLESVRFSPSPSHSEPVRFLALESDEVKATLKTAMYRGKDRLLAEYDALDAPRKIRNLIRTYYRFSEFMFQASYLFAVGTKGIISLSDRLEEAGLTLPWPKGYSDRDLTTGLALSHFILKGTELGVATCILTAPIVFMGNVADLIGCPDLRITCFVTAGFADEAPSKLPRISADELLRTV